MTVVPHTTKKIERFCHSPHFFVILNYNKNDMEYLIINTVNNTVTIKKDCPIDVIIFTINAFKGTDTKIIFEDINVTTKI